MVRKLRQAICQQHVALPRYKLSLASAFSPLGERLDDRLVFLGLGWPTWWNPSNWLRGVELSSVRNHAPESSLPAHSQSQRLRFLCRLSALSSTSFHAARFNAPCWGTVRCAFPICCPTLSLGGEQSSNMTTRRCIINPVRVRILSIADRVGVYPRAVG